MRTFLFCGTLAFAAIAVLGCSKKLQTVSPNKTPSNIPVARNTNPPPATQPAPGSSGIPSPSWYVLYSAFLASNVTNQLQPLGIQVKDFCAQIINEFDEGQYYTTAELSFEKCPTGLAYVPYEKSFQTFNAQKTSDGDYLLYDYDYNSVQLGLVRIYSDKSAVVLELCTDGYKSSATNPGCTAVPDPTDNSKFSIEISY